MLIKDEESLLEEAVQCFTWEMSSIGSVIKHLVPSRWRCLGGLGGRALQGLPSLATGFEGS